MCSRYVKRPVVVEAVKFEDNVECFDKLRALGMAPVVDYVDKDTPVILIDTLEGEHVGRVGDYIIRGVKGEFYPCRKDIFEETYEEADATDAKEPTDGLTFGTAFNMLNSHRFNYMRRPNWKPDVKIKVKWSGEMSHPYLCVESRFGTVPWKETFVEMFSTDWEVGYEHG